MPMPENYRYNGVDHNAIYEAIILWIAGNPPTTPYNLAVAFIPPVATEIYALDERGCVRMAIFEGQRIPAVESVIAGRTPEQAAQREADELYFHRCADAISVEFLASVGWPAGVGFGAPDVEAHLAGEGA